MLEQTFVHIPGIGHRTERELWESGVRSWDDIGYFKPIPDISPGLLRRLEAHIPKSIDAVKRRNAKFFERLSRLGEAWRLFPEFASECVYLDIETTGLSTVFDTVTLVGLFDGRRYEVFIEGQNLQELPSRLKKYSVVVTFNGAGFDLRFLRLGFNDLPLPPIHIDLRWITRRLGYSGGLKTIEKQFGIARDSAVADIEGYDATVLWSRHLRGDRSALDQLIAYNTEDVVHLKAIMEMCYDLLARDLGAGSTNGKKLFCGLAPLPAAPKFRKHRVTQRSTTLVTDLLARSSQPNPRIVGIDLTGSERRATGWALLDGTKAETRAILTDNELVSATLAARPDLVSIDSPLSVPEGWSEDQAQIVSGSPIYRKCELALKRMGISVFWCLLPTMKALTMRGMRLASAFREHGMHVIESYPGAAQDILGIPRKGSSLTELKLGLKRAGIAGAYLKGRVTHDEVDAITSALVGLFYLADDYIALGTREEAYLIVPRSKSINYAKLAQILAETGLDAVTEVPNGAVKCNLHGEPAAPSATSAG
jgi:uncharacterized protein YprB with RNaseH-like and TPR domain/predicted nuclease with RNAse H fold